MAALTTPQMLIVTWGSFAAIMSAAVGWLALFWHTRPRE